MITETQTEVIGKVLQQDELFDSFMALIEEERVAHTDTFTISAGNDIFKELHSLVAAKAATLALDGIKDALIDIRDKEKAK